jgi:predicted phosphate transport protein (TIGR00153 family)
MGFLWKKQEKVEKMLEGYFEQVDACFKMFEQAFATYLEMGLGPKFDSEMNNTQDHESSADDLRRDIEHTLYGRALLPDSRGDILGLLESFDRIPGVAESVLYALSCQRIRLPDNVKPMFERLVQVNLQAYYLIRKAVDNLMNNPRVTLHTTKDVEKKESESDDVEREIICTLFDSDMDTGEKILYRDMALMIGNISDLAETTADRISIIAIKRQI